MHRRISPDIALAIFCALLALGYLFSALRISSPQIVDPIGPRAFPFLIGAGLLIAALLLVVEDRLARSSGIEKEKSAPIQHGKALFGVLVWTLVYYVLFEPLGYVAATFAYLTVLLLAFNWDRKLFSVGLALCFTVGLYVVFVKLLNVHMPRGVLPF